MKRYRCPTCDTGRNAPSRLAPNDVRRFCLPCSEKSGKLVEMVCPSRERAKAKANKARTERARQTRERLARQKYYLDDGTDLRLILRDVKRVATWGREGPRAQRAVNELRLELDDNNRYLPWEQITVHVMRKASIMALTAMRHERTQSNVDSLVTDAACRYFGFSFRELRAVAKNMARLNRTDLRYDPAIIACARAAGCTPPVR